MLKFTRPSVMQIIWVVVPRGTARTSQKAREKNARFAFFSPLSATAHLLSRVVCQPLESQTSTEVHSTLSDTRLGIRRRSQNRVRHRLSNSECASAQLSLSPDNL